MARARGLILTRFLAKKKRRWRTDPGVIGTLLPERTDEESLFFVLCVFVCSPSYDTFTTVG